MHIVLRNTKIVEARCDLVTSAVSQKLPSVDLFKDNVISWQIKTLGGGKYFIAYTSHDRS